MNRRLKSYQLVLSVSVFFLISGFDNLALAQGNVAMTLDGMIVVNTGGGQAGWGGYGRFTYGPITVAPTMDPNLGFFDAWSMSEPGEDGSGVGVNFTVEDINSPSDSALGPIAPVTAEMFPLLDRGNFGVSFDPNEYVAELTYRPLEGNTATQLNLTLDTTDGFTDGGLRRGEQWQWGFFDLVNTFNNTMANGDLDEDGFAVSLSNMGVLSQAASNFNGDSFMFATAPLPAGQEGDGLPDFDSFEGGPLPVPNGAVQIHLQTIFGDGSEAIDNWEIKSVVIRKIDPNPNEVARLDGKSGVSFRAGSPFERNFDDFINIGGVDYDPVVTDQLIRFDESGFLSGNSFILNTDDAGPDGASGFGVWQCPSCTVFDGTVATMEITARLTAPLSTEAGHAEHIRVVAKDKDGSPNAPGEEGNLGGEEYHFLVDLDQFNETSMTTVSMTFDQAMVQQGFEFSNPGDGSFEDFNLYFLGVQLEQNAALVDLEVESIRIVLPGPAGIPGDYNEDGFVNAADYVVWRNNEGGDGSLLPNRDSTLTGQIGAEDYDFWVSQYGNTLPGGANSQGIPEPASWSLCWTGVIALLGRRRHRA